MKRVRILTTARFAMVRTSLALFSEKEILAAVNFYSHQPWQRRNRAWKTFDNFFDAPTLRDPPVLEWIEKAADAAEKAEQKRPPADPRVRKLQEQIGKRQADMDEFDALKKRFDFLPLDRRKSLLQKAAVELKKLCGPQTNLGCNRIVRHALVVMAREEKQ